MGAGPLALAEAAAEALGTDDVRRISLTRSKTNDVAACFDLNRQLARQVAAACEEGVLPVVLTGNCHSQQAVVAGLGIDGLGLVWLDCHGDFHTPTTTESGFFDGYALAMVVGDCWQMLCATVPGFTPLSPERVLLAGVRDLEPGERRRLDASAIQQVSAADVGALGELVGHLPVDRISLHVDLDVLDPAYGRANAYAVPPGITPDQLIGAAGAIARRHQLAALTLSAYDPACDPEGRVRDVAVEVLRAVAGG